MSTAKNLVMLGALAAVLLLGTACFKLFTGNNEPAADAAIAECAGLSGEARADCEARHQKR